MVTYAEIEAEFTAKWNTGVISLPSMKNGHLIESSTKVNRLYIQVQGERLGARSAANKNYVGRQRFFIYIVATSLANLELFRREAARIMLAMSIAGGHVEIGNFQDPEVVKKRYNQRLSFIQVKFKVATHL